MTFWPRTENEDMIAVAEGFAEYVAKGDWDTALLWAQTAEAVLNGAFLVAERPEGECRAITRSNRYCTSPALPGEPYCGLHAHYIRAHKADA
jgi:hypothetical protein